MVKVFPLEFVRQALEQKLLEEHIKNSDLYGGKEQVSLKSFFEQLLNREEVDRFVSTYRDLEDQQNRVGLIMNGIITAQENPSITNLYSTTIVPMDWSCSFRIRLEDRNDTIETLSNLIEQLKGRKVDIAELKARDEDGKVCYVPFAVGTIGQNAGAPYLKNGDFIGEVTNAIEVEDLLSAYASIGLYNNSQMFVAGQWFYVQKNTLDGTTIIKSELKVMYCDGENWAFLEDDGEHNDIIFPPEHDSFTKYKLSMSFEALACSEPYKMNGVEWMNITFGGSSTLASKGVKLGNDLVKICVSKKKVITGQNTTHTFDANVTYLEPLEQPSGLNASTQISQLVSNTFKINSHTDSIAVTLQYTFIIDEDIPLLKQWYKYSRYGIQGLTNADISPNIIYELTEFNSYWGNFDGTKVLTKLVADNDVDNTESDAMTFSISMQVQGENN